MKYKLFTIILLIFFVVPVFSEDKITTITNAPTTLTYPSFWHTPFGIHRGTPFWVKVFLGTRTYFNDPQDLAATKLLVDYGKIIKGKDDWQLTVYGVNSGNSEVIYNSSMYSLMIFGSEGKGNGELYHPKGIACNEHGDIYVADTGNNRIARFFNNSKEVRFIINIGSFGTARGKFSSPSYVALDSKGRIYVSDTDNNRIQVFSKSGGLLRIIGKDKGIFKPQGICISDASERYSGYRHDFIYIVDGNNARVQKFDFKGNLIRAVRVNELLEKDVHLTTLEQDYYGNVYVVDNLNSKIYKFSPELNIISEYGKYGVEDYEFEKPTGIAIYKHYGQVLVSDRESAQYFWIGSDIKNFRAEIIKDNEAYILQMDFYLTEKGFVTVEILVDEEKKVTVCGKLQLEAGQNSILWDVPMIYKDKYFKPGMGYKMNVRVMSTYSSYPHVEKLITHTVFFD